MTTAELGQPRCVQHTPAKGPDPRTSPTAPINTPERIAFPRYLHHQKTAYRRRPDTVCHWQCWAFRRCRQFRKGMRHDDRHRILQLDPNTRHSTPVHYRRGDHTMEPGYHHDLKPRTKPSRQQFICRLRLCAFGLSKLQRHPVNDSLRK